MIGCHPYDEWFQIKSYSFNHQCRVVKKNEEEVTLTKKEADALALLCKYSPNPVTHEKFNEYVWGGTYVSSQSLPQIIRRLRTKIDDNNRVAIITIPKLGYKLSRTNKEMNLDKPESSLHLNEYSISEEYDVESEIALYREIDNVKKLQRFIVRKILELELGAVV